MKARFSAFLSINLFSLAVCAACPDFTGSYEQQPFSSTAAPRRIQIVQTGCSQVAVKDNPAEPFKSVKEYTFGTAIPQFGFRFGSGSAIGYAKFLGDSMILATSDVGRDQKDGSIAVTNPVIYEYAFTEEREITVRYKTSNLTGTAKYRRCKKAFIAFQSCL